jgi:hypothetical protein
MFMVYLWLGKELANDFYMYGEVMDMLVRQFLSLADLVAYKGGTIERDLLSSMGVKSLILRCWVAQSTLNYCRKVVYFGNQLVYN